MKTNNIRGATNLTGATEVTNEIEENYFAWLQQSGFTEAEFLKMPEVGNFQILKQGEAGNVCYQMGNNKANCFVPIGEPFCLAENENKEMQMTLSLLLLFIAVRIEESQSRHTEFFFETAKKFVLDVFKSL